MKNLFLSVSIIALLSSCQNSKKQDFRSSQNMVQQEEASAVSFSDYEETKATLDELLLQGKRLKSGEISQEKHDALTYPLGEKFKELRASLTEKEREKLKEYGDKKYEGVYPEEDRKAIIR